MDKNYSQDLLRILLLDKVYDNSSSKQKMPKNKFPKSKYKLQKQLVFKEIMAFLQLKDVFSLKHTCKAINNEFRDMTLINTYIKANGLVKCNSLPVMDYFWKRILSYYKFKEEEYKNYIGNITEQNLYKNITEQVEKIKNNQPSSINDENALKKMKVSFDEISRDVGRTFHNDRFTKGEGKVELRRLLEALSYYRPKIGYCQGMNFIAGALLCMLNSEEKAFWIFLILITNYDMENLFTRVII